MFYLEGLDVPCVHVDSPIRLLPNKKLQLVFILRAEEKRVFIRVQMDGSCAHVDAYVRLLAHARCSESLLRPLHMQRVCQTNILKVLFHCRFNASSPKIAHMYIPTRNGAPIGPEATLVSHSSRVGDMIGNLFRDVLNK